MVCRCKAERRIGPHLAVLAEIDRFIGGTSFYLEHEPGGEPRRVPAKLCRPADALDVVVMSE